MKNLSIFAKPANYFRTTPRFDYPHLQRGSSMIRGAQVAEYLGAKYNPKTDYENDVCIYVKQGDPSIMKDGSFVDVLDSLFHANLFRDFPKIGIIVCSKSSFDYLKERKFKNNIVFIPQHHCNFDNILRDRKEITTVGTIGSMDSFEYPVEEFRKKMEENGLKYVTNYSFANRGDVVDFYKQIDIQVSWNTRVDKFKNPMRIINAASFGIPTVAFPEVGFKEFEDNFIPAKTIEELIAEVIKLKDQDYYNRFSSKIIKETEPYHISKIAEKYRELCKE